jgi:ribonuclease J
MLRIVPLGGLGHIGGNVMAIETERDLVIIDCGLLFPSEDQPGVDYVIPDLTYVTERRHKLRALVLTHGHEDHIGAVPYTWNAFQVPIYGSRFTLGLLRAKLIDFPECAPRLETLADGELVRFHDLAIEAIAVTHSIPGALALAIHTELGVLVHSGDFKLDEAPLDGRGTDSERLRELGDEGVLALLSDSTNSERSGHTYGEAAVGRALGELIANAPWRVVVTTFASNIFRLRSIIAASAAAGRHVVLAGRSIEQNLQLALQQGCLEVAPGTLHPTEHFAGFPRSGVTIIAGGSQGEPQSALSRVALGQHGDIRIEPGDRVILSSRRIPGNERAVAAVVNNLSRLGAEVIDDHTPYVHASGHAFEGEQRTLIEWCRPRFFIPIHGEYRHLSRHAALAHACGIARENIFVIEDGNPLELDETTAGVAARRGEPITAGFVYVDGKRVGDVGEVVLRDRRVLAETGMVLCVAVFDEAGGLVGGPDIVTRGVLHEEDSQSLLAQAASDVRSALGGLGPHADHASRANEIRLALRRLFRRELDSRPLVIPVVMTI